MYLFCVDEGVCGWFSVYCCSVKCFFNELWHLAVHCVRKLGAGNETRTRDPDLGKVVLYQLSYSRIEGD